MSTQNETQAINALIKAYADALNSANVKAIGTYYTSDGLLLPNGYRSISRKQLASANGESIKTENFRIEYQVRNIVVKGDFAFVESIATATSKSKGGGVDTKVTRDLFTLQKEQGAWKIFRYMFNTEGRVHAQPIAAGRHRIQ